jgi:hypothetical protein
MKTCWAAFCCALAFGRADAQPAPDVLTAKSASGQFLAFAPRQEGLPIAILQPSGIPGQFNLTPTERTDSDSRLRLDPFLLVIYCEEIKASLLSSLGRRDEWRGNIFLLVHPGLPADPGPVLEGVYSPRGWNYRLTLPSPIETNLLFHAIVQALLTETANRHAGERSAEIPLWLLAGLSAHLQADSLPTLLLPLQSRVNTNQIKLPPLEAVRGQLRRQTPLTFQELCWPEPEKASGTNYDLYCACAQVFVEELLHLKDGNRCLGAMIDKLPQHLNWQTSFLEAFSPFFSQLVDVEKWWGLACVNFTGVDFASRFGPLDSWHKLQDALDVPVQVHFSPDRLPAEAEITLQEVISTWEPAQASAALQRAFEKLLLLRPQMTPELLPLLDSYLLALQTYENDSRPGPSAGPARNLPPSLAVARNAACRRLNALDAQRAALRPQFVSQPPQTQLSARDRPPGQPAAEQPANPQP